MDTRDMVPVPPTAMDWAETDAATNTLAMNSDAVS